MGEKVTIYTLAKELNMSSAAISRAFNPTSKLSPEKRRLILETAGRYGYSPNRAAARLSQNTIRFGAIIVNRIPDFYQSMYNGISAAAKELLNQKVDTDIRMQLPEDSIVETVINILEEFKERRYSGVILHGIYSQDVIYKVNELAEAGIAVVTLHNDLPASKRLFTSTSNADMIGAMAAQLLSVFIKSDRKNVLIFTGSMSSPVHQRLFMSFSAHCASEGLTLLQSYDAMDVPVFAECLIREAFSAHPDIHGIYVSSANSLPICRFIESNGLKGKVSLVTSDTFPKLNEYIRSGIVAASIYQDPFQQGKNALEKLYQHIVENREIPQVILSNPQLVLRTNLALFE